MILDSLTNAHRYAQLHRLFATAFDYLQKASTQVEPGRYELDGERCFALPQTYATKPRAAALFEAHRRYIDVQFLLEGTEMILWAPLSAMAEETMAYNEEKDAALWKLIPEATPLRLTAGQFAIFYPEDAHAPCVEWGNSENVFKVVVKVAVE